MASLTETNEAGQYRLENIPPGRYFIAAGRIDLQTYYPGVLEMPDARDILITPGINVTSIDFVLKDSSSGRLLSGLSLSSSLATIPLKVTTEGGAKFPLFSPHGFSRFILKRTGDNVQFSVPLDQTTIRLDFPSNAGFTSEYSVSIENLPDGYSVKSIASGSADLMTGPLKLTAASFGTPATLTSTQQSLLTSLNNLFLQANGNTATPSSPPPVPYQLFGSSPATVSPAPIEVTLTATPVANPVTGARVAGKSSGYAGPRSIYISGKPGTFYSDGTFEFLGVPAGRHIIVTGDNPTSRKPLAASIIVGARNMDDLQLEETFMLPADFRSPSDPVADTRTPGSLRLVSVHGRVVEEPTGIAIPEGIVYIGGQERTSFRLQNDGRFEIPHLLPGQYKLEIQVFGHIDISRSITVGLEDIDLELSSRRFD
jgi:hypothetical protein